MKPIINRMRLITKSSPLLLWLVLLLFASCKDENNSKQDSASYVTQIETLKESLNYLISNTTYGDVPGTYPESSKAILNEAVANIDDFLVKMQNGTIATESAVKEITEKTHLAIDQFKDARRINLDPTAASLLEEIETKSISIKDMRDNVTYGNYEGDYPLESKEILQGAADKLDLLIEGIKGGTVFTISEVQVSEALAESDAIITEFKTTVRVVDDITYELLVDGNNGGYIDFGYSDDYIKFGEQGNQAFTIELWVKIKDYCNKPGEDNSTFLSTYTGGSNYRSGWRVQSRNRNILRGSVGIIDVNNQGSILWEPALDYGNTNEWVHFVFMYSDKGLDGDTDNRSKIYRNGNQTGEVIRIGEKERQYNAASSISKQMRMTAFTRLNESGGREEYFTGSIKYMRVWKTARTPGEIKSAYNGDNTVDPSDPNLVGAWDFKTKPSGDGKEIIDITGKHTAKLIGNHSWVEVVE